jgi:hypothetical protein
LHLIATIHLALDRPVLLPTMRKWPMTDEAMSRNAKIVGRSAIGGFYRWKK